MSLRLIYNIHRLINTDVRQLGLGWYSIVATVHCSCIVFSTLTVKRLLKNHKNVDTRRTYK